MMKICKIVYVDIYFQTYWKSTIDKLAEPFNCKRLTKAITETYFENIELNIATQKDYRHMVDYLKRCSKQADINI